MRIALLLKLIALACSIAVLAPLTATAIDTDGDGLDDSVETDTGIYVSPFNTGTDPTRADTDSDEVVDGVEILSNTNPTDGLSFHNFDKGLIDVLTYNGTVASALNQLTVANSSGVTFSTGIHERSGQSLRLSGNSHVDYNAPTIPSHSEYSVSVWVKSQDPTRYFRRVLWYRRAPDPTRGWSLYQNVDNLLSWQQGSGGSIGFSWFTLNANATGFANTWQHVVVSLGSGKMKMYLNGALVNQVDAPTTAPNNLITLGVGRDSEVGKDYFVGSVANIRFYSRALPHQEINDLYRNEIADSDLDGLKDYHETNTGIFISNSDTGTDPLVSDSDEDGLSDGDEIFNHQSNPTLRDSDNDGYLDGFEVYTGFNPASDSSAPDTFSEALTAVEFRFGSSLGNTYRVETSADLETWTIIEEGITGTGEAVTRFYSIGSVPRRWFRARKE